MNALNLQLLLAASGQENLLVQLPSLSLLDSLNSRIADFCSSPTVSRSLHVVPAELPQTADDISDVLGHFFISATEDKEKAGQLPQVLVISSLEEYPRHIQISLKAVLRDRRFDHGGQTYNLPKEFILVGVVTDWETLAPYMVCPNIQLLERHQFAAD